MTIWCGKVWNELYINHTGGFRHCCIQTETYKEKNFLKNQNPNKWFAEQKSLSKIREELTTNIQSPTCQKCWELEQDNLHSYRVKSNQSFYPNELETSSIKVIDLRLGNQCNLQCKMCNPMWSDQIGKVYNNFIKDGNNNKIIEQNDYKTIKLSNNFFDDLIDFCSNTPTLQIIKFAGGEPFIMPEVEYLLKELVKRKRTDLKIAFSTNCTVAKSSFVELLKQFKQVILQCSIDGVGKYIEYQRFPCKWPVIDRNFKFFLENKFSVILVPCWSQLNLLSLFDFIKWASEAKNVPVSFNKVTAPSYLDYKLIPLNYRQDLIDNLKNIKSLQNLHVDYFKFIKSIATDVRIITDFEKQLLNDAVKIWDSVNDTKYADMFPWADELLS